MRGTAAILAVAVLLAIAGSAVADLHPRTAEGTPLHRCPPIHVADHRVVARVENVGCSAADRLILAWRGHLGDPHARCLPTGDGFGICTVRHWSFACQQTPNGHSYPVTAVRARGLFKFDYPV